MDNFEKFITENSDKLDGKNPSPDLWNKIDKGLNNPAGQPSGAENATQAGGKLSTLAKLAIGIGATAVAAVGLFFALKGPAESSGPELDPNNNPSTVWAPSIAEQYAQIVNQPDEEATIPFEEFVINGEQGGEWKSSKGSQLSVPASSFVDAAGNPVTGPVDLKYREFHDGPELMLSGIPMKYESPEGEEFDFKTSGMLEIVGTQNGEPVFIAPGKSLGMRIASPTDEPDHKTWYLNPETGKWDDKGEHNILENVEKAAAMAALTPVPAKPVKPKTVGDAENMFEFSVDYDRFPELKAYQSITWEFTDLKKFEENQWIYEVAWTDGKLEAKDKDKNEYWLTLSKGKKTYRAEVIPVLKGDDYQAALADFNKRMDNYSTLASQRDNEEERILAQSTFAREFAITTFGIWNCDAIMRSPSSLAFKMDVQFEEGVYMDAGKTVLFHFTNDNRSVIPYDPSTWDRFTFDPEAYNALVTILPDGKYGIFTDEDFKKLDIQQNHKATFKMRTTKERIQSPLDLRRELGS